MFLFIKMVQGPDKQIWFISIHLMFLFISSKGITFGGMISNFNTSNVFIYHSIQALMDTGNTDFNTSNVFIYLLHGLKKCCFIDFNTSNVFIYPLLIIPATVKVYISIHLMFLFISFIRFVIRSSYYFNTSNVFIYRNFL